MKKTVDEIVDQMEQLPVINECCQTWWELQCQVEDFYSEQERQRPPLSQQKEFRSIKNAVIQEAAQLIRKAESGDPDARYLVGRLYRDGPVLLPDSVETQYWFDQSARQGHAPAQYELGKLLFSDDPEVHDTELGYCVLLIRRQVK